MNIISIVHDIKSFVINGNHIGMRTINDKLILDNLIAKKNNFSIPEISGSIYSYRNYLICSDVKNNCSLVFDLEKQIEIKLDYLMAFPFLIDDFVFGNYIFPQIRTKEKTKMVAKVRVPLFEVDSLYPINYGINGIWKIINDNLFVSENSELISISSFNNGTIWQQSFTDLLQSEEVLLRYYYIYQEKLILHLRTNGLLQNKYGSIVLDVNTGEELYRTEETLGKKLINGLGYTLYDQTLWISNPETYEVKRIDLSETLSPLNKIIDDKIGDVDLGKTEVKFRFSPDYFSVDYPYLYFSEQRGLQVGVLNIETKELVFHTEIEEKGLVKDLKSSNGKFFVHTTENNLYVFG